MKAIRIHEFGGPDVLRYEDVPDPIAHEGEWLVRVRAVGVNPVDTYVRSGTYGAAIALPYIPGTEISGEIVEGPAAGRRVFCLGTSGPRHTGCYAELATVKPSDAYELPAHLSFEQGAAVPVAYATAYRGLFERGSLQPGQTVLIHGASGGVGAAAVQLASACGAIVLGTASSEVGREQVKRDGAAAVFDHKSPDYMNDIARHTAGRGVDLVLEMLASTNLDRDLDLLAQGGRVVIVGSRGRIEIDPRKTMARETSVTGVMLWSGGDASLRRAFAAIEAGLANRSLRPVVGDVFDLKDAAKAHERIMQNASRGKVVLKV
jgi:NADPH2:quinone reductase